MSDNITLATGDVVRTELISGTHYQVNKLAFGAAGTAAIVSAADPLPVTLAAGGQVVGLVGQQGAWNVTLLAGSAAIGKLAANTTGVLIGQVEIAAAQTLATVTSLSQFGGQAIALNAGNASAGTLRVVIATDQAAVAVVSRPATSGGTANHNRISTADDNATAVKGSAGQVYSIFITNNGAAARWFKLYDKASGPSSSDTPIFRAMVPAGSGIERKFIHGLACAVGICYRMTAGIADNNNAAIAADECVIDVEYK